MKLKAEEFVDVIDEDELFKLKTDLHNGGNTLKNLVDKKLKEFENRKRKHCVTCGENLSEIGKDFTLLFGSDDFRKKASFCAQDCLEYLLIKLREIQLNDNKSSVMQETKQETNNIKQENNKINGNPSNNKINSNS